MSAPNSEKVITSLTGDGTHSLAGHEVEDVGKAAAGSSIPITVDEVARQIEAEAAAGPITKQLEKLSDLMSELRRDTPRFTEETSGLVQSPSQPRFDRFDNEWSWCCITVF